MPWVILVVMVLGLVSTLPSRGQTNAAGSFPNSHRYLMIVETSRAMHHRSDGVLQSVQDLLSSKMGGQLTNGDTIGLWTYNEKLSAGKLSVQQWSEVTQSAVSARILGFLKAQKYEKQGKIDKVLPPLGHLIKNSRVITVFLISDGTEELHGTAFDDKINNVFKLWRSQQQDAHMPFVTVLRGVRGNLTDCIVNPAPWKVELPALPPEAQVVKAAAKPSLKPPTSTAPTLPPLIMSGKKHEPSVAVQSTNANPTPTVTAPGNDAARQLAATLVPAPSPIVGTQAVPSSAVPVAADAGQPGPNAAKSEIPQTSSEPKQPATIGNEAQNLSNPSPGPDQATTSNQELVSAPTDQQARMGVSATTNAPPSQVAVLAPRAISTATLLALAALFGIVLVLGLIWFWRSRPRPTQPESLITQSFDRNRK